MALSSARVKKTVVAIVGCVKALLPLTPAPLLRGLNSIGSASLKGASLAGCAPMILASPSNFKRGRSQVGRSASQAASRMREAAEYLGDSAPLPASCARGRTHTGLSQAASARANLEMFSGVKPHRPGPRGLASVAMRVADQRCGSRARRGPIRLTQRQLHDDAVEPPAELVADRMN